MFLAANGDILSSDERSKEAVVWLISSRSSRTFSRWSRSSSRTKTTTLQKGYPEAQVRIDFLNPFFDALGWDIENKAHKPPHERDVIVELSPETIPQA